MGAQTLFHGVATHNKKDTEFQSCYELKKLENSFYFHYIVAMVLSIYNIRILTPKCLRHQTLMLTIH